MSIEAMKQALEALESATRYGAGGFQDTKDFLRQAIDAALQLKETEQGRSPEKQEPFGYFKAEAFGWTDCAETDEGAKALYETPPQRQWVGLTDEQIMQKARESGLDLEPTRNMLIEVRGQHAQLVNMARAIEAKLKEKNT